MKGTAPTGKVGIVRHGVKGTAPIGKGEIVRHGVKGTAPTGKEGIVRHGAKEIVPTGKEAVLPVTTRIPLKRRNGGPEVREENAGTVSPCLHLLR
ncbi:hypothetical protein CULT_790001 [[Clostridium] ultunense Esp]|nr:hypothetical protein CULT_790001 [[Clostridium] ultunense Esp]